jgi:hypothetical protein
MPIAKNYPVPCIREDATGWVVQLNRSCSVPVKSRDEGLAWIESKPISTKVFAQVPDTLRFEQILEDADLEPETDD